MSEEGIYYYGRFCPVWGGVYWNVGNPSFYRGGLADLSRALKAEQHDASVVVEDKTNQDMAKKYRIRKLTPKECMRLMGVKDEDTDKMKGAGISDSQMYKLAGNSIVVDVLEGIFTQLFKADKETLF